jgi:phage I-like protein
MNARILNREFQHPGDGWYQIEPKGSHPNLAAGVVQVIDDEASGLIVNRFNEEADKQSNFAGMLIDHEHFKHDQDKETRAYGWLMRLDNRADGIYGQIRWTSTGRAAVDGGDYRFFSTEYDPKDLVVLNKATTAARLNHVKPQRLDGLTLTNDPNNKGGKPITNRNEEFRRGPDGLPAGSKTQNQRTQMKSVAAKLGLSAEASEETILAEVTKAMNRVTELDGQVTPLTNRVKALETENNTLVAEQIEADFAAAGIKDEKIVNRHKPLLSDSKHFKNRAERVAFIADLAKPATAQPNTQRKLNNRDAKAPTGAAAEGVDNEAAERVMATKIQNRACELQKQMPNVSVATAYRMAQTELQS